MRGVNAIDETTEAELARVGELARRALAAEAEAEELRKQRNAAMYRLRNTHGVPVAQIAAAVQLDRTSVHELVRGPATRHWTRRKQES